MITRLVRVVAWETEEDSEAMSITEIWELPLEFKNNGQLSAKTVRKLSNMTSVLGGDRPSCSLHFVD